MRGLLRAMNWNLGSQSALKSITGVIASVNPGATGFWSAVAYVLSAVPYGPVIAPFALAVNTNEIYLESEQQLVPEAQPLSNILVVPPDPLPPVT